MGGGPVMPKLQESPPVVGDVSGVPAAGRCVKPPGDCHKLHGGGETGGRNGSANDVVGIHDDRCVETADISRRGWAQHAGKL